jgi:hypothetical protein
MDMLVSPAKVFAPRTQQTQLNSNASLLANRLHWEVLGWMVASHLQILRMPERRWRLQNNAPLKAMHPLGDQHVQGAAPTRTL